MAFNLEAQTATVAAWNDPKHTKTREIANALGIDERELAKRVKLLKPTGLLRKLREKAPTIDAAAITAALAKK